MHHHDPFRIRYRLRPDGVYQRREMHFLSTECVAYSLCQEAVLEVDAAVIPVFGRLREATWQSGRGQEPARARAREPVAGCRLRKPLRRFCELGFGILVVSDIFSPVSVTRQ